MATIGVNTIAKIAGEVQKKLMEHQHILDEAYLKRADDEKLHIGLGVDISPSERTDFKIEIGINFVAHRVRDKSTIYVDEHQLDMFEEGAAVIND